MTRRETDPPEYDPVPMRRDNSILAALERRLDEHEAATAARFERAERRQVEWRDSLQKHLDAQMDAILSEVSSLREAVGGFERDKMLAEARAQGAAEERERQREVTNPNAPAPVSEGLGKVLTAIAENIRVIVGLVSLALAAAGIGGPVLYEAGYSMLTQEAGRPEPATARPAPAVDTGTGGGSTAAQPVGLP